MKRGTSGKGTGANPLNDLSKDINKGIWANRVDPTIVNDAWRKAKEEDPQLEYRTTFLEWKKRYLKSKRRGKKR